MPSDVGHARCTNCIRTVTAGLSLAFLDIRRRIGQTDFGRDKLLSRGNA